MTTRWPVEFLGKIRMRKAFYVAVLGASLLSGCGDSSQVAQPAGSATPPPVGGSVNQPPGSGCANPAAAGTVDASVTVNVPSDFDPSSSPAPTPMTVVPFTVLMPQRCPGETFPVVL